MRFKAIAASFAILALAATAGAQTPPPSTAKQTQSLNLSAYAELLRSDVRTQKIAIITTVMGFTDAEDAAFWPIYREFDAEMSKLGDQRVAMVAEYAANYETMKDPVADELGKRAIDLESQRRATTAKYYERIKAATSPRTALRWLQVEHQLQLLIDLQISAALPIVK